VNTSDYKDIQLIIMKTKQKVLIVGVVGCLSYIFYKYRHKQ